MAANDMTDALKHPHPEVSFAHVGDETITAFTQLAEIFKNKFQKTQISGTLPFAYQGRREQKAFHFSKAHFEFSHAT
jgi:hypothetical protein